MAEIVDISVDELMQRLMMEGAPRKVLERRPDQIWLSVRHQVQAGHFLEEDDLPQESTAIAPIVADPRYPIDQWVERVVGESMNMIAPEGCLVQVVGWASLGREVKDGDLVVVQRLRAQGALRERSIKEVRISESKIELWPRSTDPRWKGPLILDDANDEDDTAAIVGLVIWVHRPMN